MCTNLSDCLVYKIEEIETSRNGIDTILYIIYDTKNCTYLVRGKRKSSKKYDYYTYSFECKHATELIDFIMYLVCPFNSINETLYNYENLPEDSNEITYSFLEEMDVMNREMAGYDNKMLSRHKLTKMLRILKNVKNTY